MLSFSRSFSSVAHGSRYEPLKGFEGEMKKKTRNEVVGAVLGMLKGQSVTANWADYRFVLKPGAEATDPSILYYYDLPPREGGKTEHLQEFVGSLGLGSPGRGRAAEAAEGGGAKDEPTGALYLDYRAEVVENGRSKSKGLAKLTLKGRHADGSEVEWGLKVEKEEEYRQWLAVFKAACKGRWQRNAPACHVCTKPFGLLRTAHHCRHCGRCVCDLCSPDVRTLEGEGFLPVRVCGPCLKILPVPDGVLA